MKNSTKGSVVTECNRPEQLWGIIKYYSPYSNLENATKNYDPPCTKMTSVTTVRAYEQTPKTNLTLKFTYFDDEYQETKNVRSFSLETLFSQVGGFIGNTNN